MDFLIKNQKKILKMSAKIDNWSHSDSLCSLLAKIYEADSGYLEPQFEKMNLHKNPWYRRISMVSLFYYSQSRKTFPSYSLAEKFVLRNISDGHYYVQKAVGWTLRELYNVYPEKTLSFVKKNIGKISSVAWVATSEKWPKNIKAEYSQLRKMKKSS